MLDTIRQRLAPVPQRGTSTIGVNGQHAVQDQGAARRDEGPARPDFVATAGVNSSGHTAIEQIARLPA
jgi:hypothetical protein